MAGYVEMLAGDAPAAERELRRGYAILDSAGDRAYLPAVAAMLASALEAQGRHAEAERYVETASSMAADGDIDTQFRLRVIRAQLLLAQGRTDEAERLVRGAVALAADTDELDLQAEGRWSWPRRCGRWVGSTRRPPPWTRRCGATRRRATWSRPDACVPPLRSGGGVRTKGNPRERDEDHFRGSVEPYSFPASVQTQARDTVTSPHARLLRLLKLEESSATYQTPAHPIILGAWPADQTQQCQWGGQGWLRPMLVRRGCSRSAAAQTPPPLWRVARPGIGPWPPGGPGCRV